MTSPLDEPLIDWASDAEAAITEPADAKKARGLLNKEKPPAGWINWIYKKYGGWFRQIFEQHVIEHTSVANAIASAQDWQTVRVVEKTTDARPGDQVTTSPSAINLGASSQVAGACTDGRYYYAIDGFGVKKWDLLDGSDTGVTYDPGWAAGTIERLGTNGAFLVIAGTDSGADEGKVTTIDLSDGSTVSTVTISSTAATAAIRRVRVGHTHAFVGRTATGADPHDTTRILLSDGTSTDLELLSYGGTDSAAGLAIDDEHVYIGDSLNEEVLVYDEDGSNLLYTCTHSTGTHNLRDALVSNGKIFALFAISGGGLELAAFHNYGGAEFASVVIDAVKTDRMFAIDDEYVYVLVGDAGGAAATIELYAFRVEDLTLAWRRTGTYPSPNTAFGEMFSDGVHLWADTTTPGNPQIRRLYTGHRAQLLTKIPPGVRGQKFGLLMTRDR
jgi:hypothetical protein